MALTPGSRLGPYEVIAQIGVGGMGEVYRATDTNLKRAVAIKVLPESVASDVERLARFQREAEVLASLNHPNIAAIYGLERSGGKTALVMELVEGPTLADRIAQGALPVDEALPLAEQIAEALEAAHERGIIHRDLKPANVKVRPDGTVKVLDFGLAKALEPQGAVLDASQSPTITSPAMTRMGVILGTAAYMSPEQARGKAVDKRSDIWAFGCVIYEMLTGRRAFAGDEVSDVLASVLAREPDWTLLPAGLSPVLATFIKRCLQKDRKQRIGDVQSLRLALDGAFETAASHVGQSMTVAQPVWRRPIVLGLATAMALLAAAIGGVVVWTLARTTPAAGSRVARLTMQIGSPGRPGVAISPAGTHVAYIAMSGDREQLYLRALHSVEAKALPGTESASSPFFSPDGQWIGFFAQGKLKKVSLAAGTTQTLSDAPLGGAGGSWAADGSIYYAPTGSSGLLKVSANGGTPTAVTTLDRAKGEVSHREPHVLPGGRVVMLTMWTGPGLDEQQIHVQRLDTGERTIVVRGGGTGRYVPTGHVVFVRRDELFAVPFDLDRLQVSGEVVRLADAVLGDQYAVSDVGELVYLPGSPQAYESRLVWVARDGRVEALAAPLRNYHGNAVISPDGHLAAVDVDTGTIGIWLYDFSRATLTPLTTGSGSSQAPRWTPDGKRIVYRGTRTGFRNLWWKTVDDSMSEERLASGERTQHPGSWSADGQWLVYTEISLETGPDVWALPAGGDRKPRVIVRTPFDDGYPRLSPDGHWLAYTSDESGRMEVFVQPFTGPGRRSQISNDGGAEPVWSRDGRELFYLNGDKMMAVEITTTPAFKAGTPRLLFEGRYRSGPTGVAGYDVTSDGQRFLRVQPVHPDPPTNQIHVVLNWLEELKRLVPTN